MTLWLLQLTLGPQEEEGIQARTHLPLPFEGMPDLSVIQGPQQCMSLLRALHPDEPPESLTLKLDRIWTQYSTLHEDDLIAVPLPLMGKLALARITGPYAYDVSAQGEDVHTIPVTWYPKLESLRSFGRNKGQLLGRVHRLATIEDQTLRRAIYQRLPYKYNRFVKLRWIYGLFFLMGLLRLAQRMKGM